MRGIIYQPMTTFVPMNDLDMLPRRTLALAALPGAAAYAVWRYRRAIRELDGYRVVPPRLPGRIGAIPTPWGRIAFRHMPGDTGPTLVLVHGWGRTADSAWWPVFMRTHLPVLAVDLPGHGRSVLDGRFTFDLATDAVLQAIEVAGVERPILVGHSMGGAIALTAIRRTGPAAFSGFVGLASSAYWVRPRQQLIVAAAPYVMAQRSPFLMRAQRGETRRTPEDAHRIAWEYAVRPPREVLVEAAFELRRFDARRWADLELPPTTWVITAKDGVLDRADQLATAELFGGAAVELPTDHSVVIEAPDQVCRILHAVANGGPILVAV